MPPGPLGRAPSGHSEVRTFDFRRAGGIRQRVTVLCFVHDE